MSTLLILFCIPLVPVFAATGYPELSQELSDSGSEDTIHPDKEDTALFGDTEQVMLPDDDVDVLVPMAVPSTPVANISSGVVPIGTIVTLSYPGPEDVEILYYYSHSGHVTLDTPYFYRGPIVLDGEAGDTISIRAFAHIKIQDLFLESERLILTYTLVDPDANLPLDSSSSPRTGDARSLGLFSLLCFFSVSGLMCIAIAGKTSIATRKRNAKD